MKFEKILLTLKGLVAKKMIKTHKIEKKIAKYSQKLKAFTPCPPRVLMIGKSTYGKNSQKISRN